MQYSNQTKPLVETETKILKKKSTNDKFNNNNNLQEKLFHEEIIVLDTSVWEVAGSQYNNSWFSIAKVTCE